MMFKLACTTAAGIGLLVAGTALAAGQPSMDKFKAVSQVVGDKCMACHTQGYDLPFYAKVPGIKKIIEEDFKDGIRAMDLNTELVNSKSKVVGETVLSKMEWVIQHDTMPPAKFAAVHWGSRLSDKEKQNILDWVKETRKAHYATDAAPAHANEPIQPIPLKMAADEKKVALGDKMFNDKRLATDSTLACAGCHFYERGGTDNRKFSLGIRDQEGGANPPTMYNAVFNLAQFWDGRATDLANQVFIGPPLDPKEMGNKDWDEIVARLSKDEELVGEFKAIYADGMTGQNIADAIGEYEKTLITPNSRFDKWLRGDDKAISAEEQQGYERFKAYRCASCHVGKSVGGQSYEFIDLKGDYFAARKGQAEALGSDLGHYNVTKNEADKHRIKVPNLRNVELTWPYMHDGSVATLDEAVRVMGTFCAGMEVPEGDRGLIVGFLRTLTGEGKLLDGKPVEK